MNINHWENTSWIKMLNSLILIVSCWSHNWLLSLIISMKIYCTALNKVSFTISLGFKEHKPSFVWHSLQVLPFVSSYDNTQGNRKLLSVKWDVLYFRLSNQMRRMGVCILCCSTGKGLEYSREVTRRSLSTALFLRGGGIKMMSAVKHIVWSFMSVFSFIHSFIQL